MPSPIPQSVLIVEDEHLLAIMLQDMVESLGVAGVRHAATLDEGLKAVEISDFDFAFLDINLGEENSLPIARLLEDRNIPFVFASGYDSNYDAQGISAPLLRKPLGIEDIKRALTRPQYNRYLEAAGRIG